MHPLKHVLLTIIIAAPAAFFLGGLDISSTLVFMIVAIIGNLLVDAVDHSLIILFGKDPLVKRTQRLLKARRVRKAFSQYYGGRKRGITKAYLHTRDCALAVLGAGISGAILFGVWSNISAFVLFGSLAHFAQDLFEDLVCGKNPAFWLR